MTATTPAKIEAPARPWMQEKPDRSSWTPAETNLDRALRRVEAALLGVGEPLTPEGMKAVYDGMESAIVDFAVERNDVICTLSAALQEAAAAVENLSVRKRNSLVDLAGRPIGSTKS